MYRLVIKGAEIMARSGEPNTHRLSLKARISYPTIERIVNRAKAQESISLTVLGTLLTDGLGLTPEEALDLPLSAIFDIERVEP